MGIRFFFVWLSALGLFFAGCASKHRVKTIPPPTFPSAVAPTFAVDPNVLQRVPFHAIQGTNPAEMKSLIRQFPLSAYEMVGVYSGFEVEYFCVDSFTDYIKNILRTGQAWETHLTPYIFKYCRQGSIVVDIGAHIGTHVLQFSRAVGKTGKVYAVEPQPKSFQELVVNMTLNQTDNIEYFWGAMGAEKSSIELSPLNAENEGGTGFGGSTGKFVEMIPLDSLNLENVSLIKIDVEGMEVAVLEGAKETILRNRPVLLIEIMGGVRPESAGQEAQKEILSRIQFVEEMGYEMIRLCGLWDYLALPKNSPEFQEIAQTKVYRDHLRQLKRWAL